MLRTIAICVLLVADPCWAGVSVRGTANQATVYAHLYNGTTWLHVAMAQTASGSGVYTVADATIDNTLSVDCRTVAGLESGFPVVCNNSATDQTAVFLDGPREGVLDWDGSSERLPASVDELESGLPEPIAPTTVHEKRTWYAGAAGYKSDNVREVKAFAGTLTFAACPALNPEADIDNVESVVVTGPASEAASTLTVRADGRAVHFNLSSVTTVGSYTIVVTGNTKDGQEVSLECLLKVR